MKEKADQKNDDHQSEKAIGKRGALMDVFRVVKDNVTARQMAEYYGIKIGRNGMACCPFHDDQASQYETG